MTWMQRHENQMFIWVNKRNNRPFIDLFFNKITHLGGARIIIVSMLSIYLLTSGHWSAMALQAIVALTLSHIPVAIIKKKYPRLRPYLVMPQTNTCKKPLTDHSFPSGHTTAIFAVLMPFIIGTPYLFIILLPIAFAVTYSRVYLGLHYPSDCVAGALIGAAAAILAVISL